MKAWKVTSERNVELVDMGAQPVAENCVKLKMLTALVGTHESSLYKKGGNSLPIIAGRQGVGMVTEVGENVTAFKKTGKHVLNRAKVSSWIISHVEHEFIASL